MSKLGNEYVLERNIGLEILWKFLKHIEIYKYYSICEKLISE